MTTTSQGFPCGRMRGLEERRSYRMGREDARLGRPSRPSRFGVVVPDSYIRGYRDGKEQQS